MSRFLEIGRVPGGFRPGRYVQPVPKSAKLHGRTTGTATQKIFTGAPCESQRQPSSETQQPEESWLDTAKLRGWSSRQSIFSQNSKPQFIGLTAKLRWAAVGILWRMCHWSRVHRESQVQPALSHDGTQLASTSHGSRFHKDQMMSRGWTLVFRKTRYIGFPPWMFFQRM